MEYSEFDMQAPNGKDYSKREDWTRREWRNIWKQKLRLCPGCVKKGSNKKWWKISVLKEFNGLCQNCRREAETNTTAGVI